MKKKIYIGIFLVVISFSAFAQAPVNLFDPFYEDMSMWENSGLINDAPSIRPYPLQEIERLLQIVMERGDAGQRRKAAEYKARFFGRAFHFGGSTEFNFGSKGSEKQLFVSPFFQLNYSILKFLTVSAYVSFNIMNKLDAEGLNPAYSYSQKDIASDVGSIGKLRILPMFNSSITIGTPQYYLTAGLGRTSYGPFHDSGIFVSRHAFHAGQFIFTVNKEKWAYNHVLLLLSATDDKRGNITPNKFLSVHSIDFRPLTWLSFSLIDSMVFGGRFEPMYLIPFSAFFLGQSVYNFPDNSLLGLSCTVKPIRGLRLDMALYADDLGFNEIIKFKKDAKWRMSGEFGLSYTMPQTHWFSFIDLNYTFITPYAYTHYHQHTHTRPNYQNYTHHGKPLGSNLEPNSDRIQVRLKFRPLHGLDINFSNTFIRHANITESVTDIDMLKGYLSKQYTTDGSSFNHSAITAPLNDEAHAKHHAFLYATPFMKQQTIQYVNQLGLDVSCHLPILKSGGNMLFKIGYVFEADINPGVRKNIYQAHWDETTIGSASVDEIRKKADTQLARWRKDARGKQFNHYIRLSAEVAY